MATLIAQKQLRNEIGSVLRRVEAGEAMTVTVAGRPVAELHPAARRTWVGGPALSAIWADRMPTEMELDLEAFNTEMIDPFAQ
ncbi:MAG: type II toxin-antitoxin system prevent-host-death family antitoxin [Promicromonosporaceae bacterium]|nr:type II toxin-antitoxin system prevent-host-death family antitoxin [Promicromonosporaceae bacterium]